jgi:hypothetical protein
VPITAQLSIGLNATVESGSTKGNVASK